MDLRLLRSFIAVAEHGNFGAAGRSLSTSQPALTKRIQGLERQLGTALFTRGRQGAVLTAAGQALLSESVSLVQRADALEQRMRRVISGGEGSLSIGFGMSAIDAAPRAVAAFRAAHPAIEVALEDMSSSAQFDAIHSGHIDIGFVRLPAPPDIATRRVGDDRLALAVPRSETVPGPGRDALRGWLAGRSLIRLAPARGPGLTAQIDALFCALDCLPETLQEASDLLTVLALVAAGVGSAIVPASASVIVPASVRLLPIELPSSRWQIGMAWLRENDDPMISLFLKAGMR